MEAFLLAFIIARNQLYDAINEDGLEYFNTPEKGKIFLRHCTLTWIMKYEQLQLNDLNN